MMDEESHFLKLDFMQRIKIIFLSKYNRLKEFHSNMAAKLDQSIWLRDIFLLNLRTFSIYSYWLILLNCRKVKKTEFILFLSVKGSVFDWRIEFSTESPPYFFLFSSNFFLNRGFVSNFICKTS